MSAYSMIISHDHFNNSIFNNCLQCTCLIVLFCCCLFTSSVFSWQRLPSLCRFSPWILSVLQSFVCKSFPARINFQPLVESTVVEFAVLFYLPEILDGDSPTVNIDIIHRWKNPSSWIKPEALSSMAIGCLETHNALWRHYCGWRQGGHQPNSIDL